MAQSKSRMMGIDDFLGSVSRGGGIAMSNMFEVQLPPVANVNGMQKGMSILCSKVDLPMRQVTTIESRSGVDVEKVAYGYAVADVAMSFYLLNDYSAKQYFEAWQNLAVNQQTYELGYKSGPGGYGKQVKIHQLAALTGQFNPQAERSAIARRGRKGPIQFDGKAKDRALEKVIYTCVLEKAFPTTLNSIEMNSEQGGLVEVSIQLSYTDWRSE